MPGGFEARAGMKLLTWNILHGGGARRMPEIVLALLGHDADVVVLTEFRTTTGGQIRAVLDDHGWRHQLTSEPEAGCNGILIAARQELEAPAAAERRTNAHDRFLQAYLPQADTHLVAVHIPDRSMPAARTACWRAVLHQARLRREASCVVLGDFNTGRHRLDEAGSSFNCTALLGELSAIGYADAWRLHNPEAREFSWRSRAGNGFRIDSAFISRPLRDRVTRAFYSHAERERRVSDHSLLIVDVA